MLLDPLPVLTGITSATYTGGVSKNFDRLTDGKYIGSNIGSLAHPQQLTVTNRLNFLGSSQYTVTSWENIPVEAINGIPQKDDVLKVSVQISYPHRSGSAAQVEEHVFRLASMLTTEVYLDKILRGNK